MVSEQNLAAYAIQNSLNDLDIIHGGEKRVGEIVIPLKNDNQGLITLAYNPVFYLKIKHINIQYHYLYDKMALGRIELL